MKVMEVSHWVGTVTGYTWYDPAEHPWTQNDEHAGQADNNRRLAIFVEDPLDASRTLEVDFRLGESFCECLIWRSGGWRAAKPSQGALSHNLDQPILSKNQRTKASIQS